MKKADGKFMSALCSRHSTLAFRLLLLALAVAFVILGALNGEALEVFKKAVRICLECIGIG